MSKERTTPKIEPKLAGQQNYAQWILSIEQTLSLYDHGTGSVWDIVTGATPNPGTNIKPRPVLQPQPKNQQIKARRPIPSPLQPNLKNQ